MKCELLKVQTEDQIRLDGTRGGAGLVAAAVNALLRQVAS